MNNFQVQKQKKQTLWPESASELYSPSDRHLAKLVPTFEDRGESRRESGGSPTAIISVF
jgi:hypothetical protein